MQETPILSSWPPSPLSPPFLPLLSQKIYWRGEARLTKLQAWALRSRQECFDPSPVSSDPQPIALPNLSGPLLEHPASLKPGVGASSLQQEAARGRCGPGSLTHTQPSLRFSTV